MKKTAALLLSFLFAFSCAGIALAADTVKFTGTVDATVLRVLDGDSLLVKSDNGELGYVHFAGITTAGFDPAFKYVSDELLGSRVTLLYDASLSNASPRWNYMYVYKNGISINEQLLANGFAKITTGQSSTIYYQNMLKLENEAKYKKLGVWSESEYSESIYYSNRMVNINLAGANDIVANMEGVPQSVAANIVRQRNEAPFRTVSDIKFVDGFTKKMYDDNFFRILVSTDINSAAVEELTMLEGLTLTEARSIVTYRQTRSFSSIDDLTKNSLLSKTKFNLIKNYISVAYEHEVVSAIPDVVVNVNTATSIQLQQAGLDRSFAEYIINNRVKGYTIKYLGELTKYKDSPFTTQRLNNVYDNLRTKTDINEASQKELVSLFGTAVGATATADQIIARRPFTSAAGLANAIGETAYDKIQDYIYIGSLKTAYVNVNTASEGGMKMAGFSGVDAYRFVNASKKMLSPKDLPADVSNSNHHVALYTNINASNKDELMHLNNLITDSVAERILTYVTNQPFGSMEELEEFFKQNALSGVYKEIRDFVVLR